MKNVLGRVQQALPWGQVLLVMKSNNKTKSSTSSTKQNKRDHHVVKLMANNWQEWIGGDHACAVPPNIAT